MADVLKFIIALAACIALMLVIRTYGFALYTIPDDSLKPMLAKGQRVLVNKLSRSQLKQGDAVVFGTGGEKMAGRIVAVPGDTVDVDGEQYLIPTRCQIDYDCECDRKNVLNRCMHPTWVCTSADRRCMAIRTWAMPVRPSRSTSSSAT